MSDTAAQAASDGLWFAHALVDGRWERDVRLGIAQGTIVSIDVGAPAQAGDVHAGIGVPGLPNLHSHAFQRAIAGLTEVRDADGSSFWTWREAMYRFVDRLAPDQVEAVTAFAYAEMLEAGFTRVGEFHYLHHAVDGAPYAVPAEMSARIAAAAAEAGIRLTLLPVLYNRSGFGGTPARPAQRRFVSAPDAYVRLVEGAESAVRALDGGIVGVAAHSLRAVTPDELAVAAKLRPDRPLHVHVAEQVGEVEDCVRWSGLRPVRWLLENADVDARWCLVHATHVDEGELADVARARAVVGLCPITEANLGDGIFPAARFAALGGRFGIGSDSNVRIDAAEELSLLEYGQRLVARERNVLALVPGRSTARALFDAAATGGAAALGADEPRLAVGHPADVVALDAVHPAFVAHDRDALLDAWVFAGRREVVRDVWVHGRRVVADGRHVRRDAIAARYARVVRTVLAG